MIKKLTAFFSRPKPVYGEGIFYQRSWLSRQVDEALYKRSFNLD